MLIKPLSRQPPAASRQPPAASNGSIKSIVKSNSRHFFVYRRSFVILHLQLYNVTQCTEILLAVNFG